MVFLHTNTHTVYIIQLIISFSEPVELLGIAAEELLFVFQGVGLEDSHEGGDQLREGAIQSVHGKVACKHTPASVQTTKEGQNLKAYVHMCEPHCMLHHANCMLTAC